VTGETVFVLASNSPRRSQLLALTGWTFTVSPADIDESRHPSETPAGYVLRLAQIKAREVAPLYPTCLVLAADTAVVDGEDVLGKPASPAEAVQVLQHLRGHTHQVLTAIAIMRTSDGRQAADLCVTPVPMRAYLDQEIQDYVASGDPLDKAGAYAIQHAGFHPVLELAGCYANVMGLPLCHLVRSLRHFDIAPRVDVPAACQSALRVNCPVFRSILGI
jgi:septum formation protein